jgi:hypothetical protein
MKVLIRSAVGNMFVGAVCLMLVAFLIGCGQERAGGKGKAKSKVAGASKTGSTISGEAAKNDEEVSCDGKNKVSVPKDATGKERADALLAQWRRNNADRDWVAHEKEAHALIPPADNSDVLKGGQRKGHAYGDYTETDILIWARETEKMVAEGSRIFHSGDALGSTVGVSCDMCHPHASNTHPETYPKFQTQIGRVALLRDMINWCIENPVRGKKLAPDSPEMRALEAYILSQRKGATLNYGKH